MVESQAGILFTHGMTLKRDFENEEIPIQHTIYSDFHVKASIIDQNALEYGATEICENCITLQNINSIALSKPGAKNKLRILCSLKQPNQAMMKVVDPPTVTGDSVYCALTESGLLDSRF
ncbi:hypothetical protein A3A76_05980 [Candidatus Woesebacteria bacterium RIFCSPLOWO2_01_FULL_39_23]|uniref:Uncharacterized protein n=1 Tax=Candidatus Woesebacteria bacterium RIFCSPHIGHO2_01_FULL_40_22 TaxID=1802499 RepID=A0A1F7YHX7_9BACT|nr:MAG: hypothetical protein A2141_02680 [Candidatus Woesebacteria bacterium RBG_16_40_11]OGM26951.1 MAG: hypothetical protein A2628_05925 [Candidatus Woesebacteria bacterium RIFCSPHIGHO2_01_FULL_40_22]OGM37358.1 MAG: hypothetical protein A3E41_04330 [Candidatus Woesebacteria bacterium RIFCSPHIGHO2_12_FULL_38_9]OGM63225.1 MAG: hypothetical protein A3A76_05980 [Candidatus Woesebacteria bacterium RIFCSPLOWO2_01_FULL_39_23]